MSVVVGIGNRSRGDDGVGPLVAERVAALGLPGVRVLTEAEPLDLVEVLAAHDDVVVVDALAPRGHPGRVVVWSLDGPWPAGRGGRPIGSHGIGVLEAVELARALGGLAARLTVVGVEAGTLETRATLSAQWPSTSTRRRGRWPPRWDAEQPRRRTPTRERSTASLGGRQKGAATWAGSPFTSSSR